MSGERVKRMVSTLLGEAEAAAVAGDWARVEERCRAVLGLQPGEEFAMELLAAAQRAMVAATEPMAVRVPHAERFGRQMPAGTSAERSPNGDSRFSYEATRFVNAGQGETMNAVFRACVGMRIRVVQETSVVVVGKLGSARKVRLLGAWIAGARSLPIRVDVHLAVLPGQNQLTVVVSEDFGFGSLKGIDSRARERCSQVAAELADAIVARVTLPS